MSKGRADIAFDDLLSALRAEGFSLSPTDYIEFAAVFNQYSGSREDLKYYLAPILCRNREDQLKFYAIYDRYTTPPESERREPREPIFNPYLSKRTAGWFLRRASRLYYGWLFIISLALSIGQAVFNHYHKKQHPTFTVFAPDSTSAATAQPAPAPEKPKRRKFVVKAGRPARTPEERSIVIPTGPEVEKENLVHSSAFAWLFVLGMAALCLSISFFPLKRSRSVPQVDIDKLGGEHGPLDIPFKPKDHLIRELPILAKIARDLAQPVPTDRHTLEINATIRESIRSCGLITPVYLPVERRPEWLMLIDPANPLRAATYRYLARTLAKYGLPIDYYYHDGVDNYYAEGSRIPLNGYQVRQRHGDAQIIDIDGTNPLTRAADPDNAPLPAPLTAAFDFDEYLLSTNILLIRRHLDDPDLFQWLCALAVYPTVRWEVTLAVGAAVLKQRNALHLLHFGSLLRITQFHWLATPSGAIPGEIRLNLLKLLGQREELAARQAILDLLAESDDIITTGTAAFDEKMLQVYTQSFVLFAHDARHNKAHEADARHFMSVWDRRNLPDLATVIYLRNPDQQWATPIRSAENPRQPATADRFIHELLALKVIADPKIRAFFRNLAATFFFLLLLLYLFKDNLEPTALNASLDLIKRDYPTGAVTVKVPVTDCLRKMTKGHQLLVTLNNYDNNRYSQRFDIDGKDTLRAHFEGITMSDKDTSEPALQLILNNTLTIDCPEKKYYSTYTVLLRGADCDPRLTSYSSSHFRPASYRLPGDRRLYSTPGTRMERP